MRRYLAATCTAVAVTFSVVLLAGGTGAGALAAPAGSHAPGLIASWGKSLEVPGTAALNTGNGAHAQTISCPTAGSCTAGGFYTDAPNHEQGYVVAERKGKWGKAQVIPGLAALDVGGQVFVASLSCAAPGYCSVGGTYLDGSARTQAFVAGESRGKWGKAAPVPGLAALNADGNGGIESLSCPARGDCSAGGDYQDGSGSFQAFVVTESKGKWGKAAEVPGTPALDAGGGATLDSVSCMSAGNCSAGGYYIDAAARREAFVVTQTHGHWGKAAEVPGSAALNAGGKAEILSVSCTSPGNCTAGGYYSNATHHQQGLLVVQKKGKWGKAAEVPGLAKLNTGNAEVTAVSCARSADCSAVGYYADHLGFGQTLVVSQARGRWGRAMEIPGTGRLNKHGFAQAETVSCASAGSCSASGFYLDGSNHEQLFVVTELTRKWGNAIEIPGSAALDKGGNDAVFSVACASAGNCSAGGSYSDGAGHSQAFVVNETARRRK